MKEQFDFGRALVRLKEGKRVERSGWNGKGMWIRLQSSATRLVVGGDEERCGPYIEMKTVGGTFVPWLASQTDVLAEDWMEAD